MKKRMMALLLALLVLVSAAALAEGEKQIFTDSLGRQVEVDQEITRIAVSGQVAQIVVFALAPDKLVGIAGEWDARAEMFLDTEYYQLPVLGHLYGGKGSLNLEVLLSAAPQVVIDVGEPKEGIVEDLDALTEQTGIPFVHVSSYLDSMDKTYTMLGELLGMEEEAKELAAYCTDTYSRMVSLANSVEKAKMLYVTGEKGLNVIGRDSYQSEAIDLMGDNLAVLESPSSKGTGNEVDMEQMLIWNPDVIIFSEASIYPTVHEDEMWQAVTAIAENRYYEVPVAPYNWLGFPPSGQRLLGMIWMGKVLYPDAAQYDLYEEVARYFDLFYHCSLTQEQFDGLTAHSLVRE